MWVFAYGSLMWDGWELRHGCEQNERATLTGYRRSFNKKSTGNWGSPSSPGPVLGLEPDPKAECLGMAFRFPEERAEEVFGELRDREGPSYDLRELEVRLSGGNCVTALAAANDPEAGSYIGNLGIGVRARMARAATGTSGPCADYVRGIDRKLRALGIQDDAVREFAAAMDAAV